MVLNFELSHHDRQLEERTVPLCCLTDSLLFGFRQLVEGIQLDNNNVFLDGSFPGPGKATVQDDDVLQAVSHCIEQVRKFAVIHRTAVFIAGNVFIVNG